mgnify:CR=1 FL=1
MLTRSSAESYAVNRALSELTGGNLISTYEINICAVIFNPLVTSYPLRLSKKEKTWRNHSLL